MSRVEIDWTEFHRNSLGRPARELLTRTLGCFELESQNPGVAVDLGCGAGIETIELLRRGWRVHAVDTSSTAIELLKRTLPAGAEELLDTHTTDFQEFEFPECDLIWAGYSWPYCKAGEWVGLWNRMVAALRPGGRIVGDVFGESHAWASEPGIQVLSEQATRSQLNGLVIEAFDIENGVRATVDGITRWHSFGISARKP